MDPQVTWRRLVTSVNENRWNDAASHALDMLHWFDRGGFAPYAVSDETIHAVSTATQKWFVMATCKAVIQRSEQLEKRASHAPG